jgi:hypothetical protein
VRGRRYRAAGLAGAPAGALRHWPGCDAQPEVRLTSCLGTNGLAWLSAVSTFAARQQLTRFAQQ